MNDPATAFWGLVEQYRASSTPHGRSQAQQRIWERFGQHRAVFVSDLSRFTVHGEQSGIVHALALFRECHALVAPLVLEQGGVLVKTIADNLYALFPTASHAIAAGIDAQALLGEHNARCPPDQRIDLCVGIGAGEILVIPEQDFYGHEVNLAFKLGEDIAEPGEVLVTHAAMQAADPGSFSFEPRTVCVSGVDLPYAAARRRCAAG